MYQDNFPQTKRRKSLNQDKKKTQFKLAEKIHE